MQFLIKIKKKVIQSDLKRTDNQQDITAPLTLCYHKILTNRWMVNMSRSP